MSILAQNNITGKTAVKIAEGLESAIRTGRVGPGELLPTVRDLARDLGVSPATVASAYKALQARAVVVGAGRRGTRVTHRPLAARPRRQIAPTGAVILNDGNPDPALLPRVDRALHSLKYVPRLYGEEPLHRGLIDIMRKEMKADGVRANRCFAVNGTMDGLDRLFAEHLRPGDRVAVEDPGFTGHHDLIASRGLTLVPVMIDEQGMLPESLERACRDGVHAVLITPRAQSPTGATLTAQRAAELRAVLQTRTDIFVIEDDHVSFLCEGVYQRVHHPKGRWAHLRSFSKSFNPDLRLSVMTGDDETMTRMLDRLIVVERWVSYLLQSLAHELVKDRSVRAGVRKAGRVYDQRRTALTAAFTRHGLKTIDGPNLCGYNIWAPVHEESYVVQAMAAAGWAVAAGERFRLGSSPGIRITVSRLKVQDALRFAADLAEVLAPSHTRPLA